MEQTLDIQELELYFYRIDCAYSLMSSPLGLFKIKSPDKHIRYQSSIVFQEKMIEAQSKGIFEEKEIEGLLFFFDLWDSDKQAELITLPKEIDQCKVDIYKNFFSDTREIRKTLSEKQDRLSELNHERHRYDLYTDLGFATFAKSQFILENTVYFNDKLYDFKEIPLHTFLSFVNDQMIYEREMRFIAQSEPWSSIYENRKNGRIFEEETDDQRRLLIYTLMYENVRNNNPPPEEIINDCDALDGWMIDNRKKIEKEKQREFLESKIKNSKIKNAQEVFIKANTIEEARAIEEMNSEAAAMNKKRRLLAADKKGTIGISDMPDVVDKVRQELHAKLQR